MARCAIEGRGGRAAASGGMSLFLSGPLKRPLSPFWRVELSAKGSGESVGGEFKWLLTRGNLVTGVIYVSPH